MDWLGCVKFFWKLAETRECGDAEEEEEKKEEYNTTITRW